MHTVGHVPYGNLLYYWQRKKQLLGVEPSDAHRDPHGTIGKTPRPVKTDLHGSSQPKATETPLAE